VLRPLDLAARATVLLVGAILLEENDEWAVERSRYVTLEAIAPLNNDHTVSLPPLPLTSPADAGERGDPLSATPHLGARSTALMGARVRTASLPPTYIIARGV